MTILSWIYMISVWCAIAVLNVYCFYKVFQNPHIERVDQSEDQK